VLLALVAACSAPAPGGTRPAVPAPATIPESSGYRRTCSHAELMSFLDAVSAAGDPRVVRTSFGTTPEGRELPLLIVADPPLRDAAAALASGKPRVLVMANIHAGEVEGKEACLELLREIVWGAGGDASAEPYPVGDVVLLLAPIYNADGNDHLSSKNREKQNGPPFAGQRQTAAGLDLNRDYLKAEAPETRALLALIRAWDPQVVVDLHTTDGSIHGYELTYSSTLSPSAHPLLLDTMNRDWLPTLRERMRERWGFETFDYGNFMTGLGPKDDFKDEPDTVTGWRTYDHRPRFGSNYVGLRNRLAILSEAYSYADFQVRIAASKAFVIEILRLSAERGESLGALCRRLDEETASQGASGTLVQATASEMASRGVEPLLLRGVEKSKDPETGEEVQVATGPRTTIEVPMFVAFKATASKPAPRAYLFPAERGDIVDLLEAHGLRYEVLGETHTHLAQTFLLMDPGPVAEPFPGTAGHRPRQVVWDMHEGVRSLPAGTVRVPLDQPLARVAFQLLDPESDDGLVVWNFWDDVIDRGRGAELPVWGEFEADH
jgi:hypothetical protein